MPVSLKYVHELPWKAISQEYVEVNGEKYIRSEIERWVDGLIIRVYGTPAMFSKECKAKLLAAMDNFGKVEEPERWKSTAVWAKSSGVDAVGIYPEFLLELRDRLMKFEAKLEELSKK